MNPATSPLPHWDMTVVYPALEAPEFERGFQAVITQIHALVQLFDQFNIGRQETPITDEASITTFDHIITELNATLEQTQTLDAYIYAFVATDSRNALAQARLSALHQHTAKLEQLGARLIAWIGSLDVERRSSPNRPSPATMNTRYVAPNNKRHTSCRRRRKSWRRN